MRVLVYGGRNYGVLTDNQGAYIGMDAKAALKIVKAFTWFQVSYKDTIISGGATGADALGEAVAQAFHAHTEVHPAEWDLYGRSAGPIRNQQMLESKIDVAIKCPGGKGTTHMTGLLEEAGVPIYEV